jgi:hypothetical protein
MTRKGGAGRALPRHDAIHRHDTFTGTRLRATPQMARAELRPSDNFSVCPLPPSEFQDARSPHMLLQMRQNPLDMIEACKREAGILL